MIPALEGFGLIGTHKAEEIAEGPVLSLPASVRLPTLKLADRFLCVDTPLIRQGEFLFADWISGAGQDLKGRIELVYVADSVVNEAIALTAAAYDCFGDYRATPCLRFFHLLQLAAADRESSDLSLAYLPCTSVIALHHINLIHARDSFVDVIAEAEGIPGENKLRVLREIDQMLLATANLIHFQQNRLLPGAELSLSESVPIRGWWTDLLRTAKSLRQTVPFRYQGEKAETQGARKLYHVVTACRQALDAIVDQKRKSWPKPEPAQVNADFADDTDQLSSEQPFTEQLATPAVRTKIEQALAAKFGPGPDGEVISAIPLDVVEEYAVKRVAKENWSLSKLQALTALRKKPLKSSDFFALVEKYPWCEGVLLHIARSLAFAEAHGQEAYRIKPILLVGEPGVGKTYVARKLAALVGPHMLINMAGSDAAREIDGTNRGYSTATPSSPVRLMAQSGSYSGALILDEIDKTVASQNGNAANSVLNLLESSTADAYQDGFLGCPVDTRGMSYVATANGLSMIPPALLSRFTIFHLRAPERQHYPALIRSMIEDLASELGVHPAFLTHQLDGLDHEILSGCRDIRHVGKTLRLIVEYKTATKPLVLH